MLANQTTTVAAAVQTQAPSPFSSLRLTQNFSETLGVEKVLTTVPVGRPSKDRFFRTHPSPNLVVPAILKVAQVSTKRTPTLKAPEVTQGDL